MRLQDPTAAASASTSVTGGAQQTLLSAAWGSLGQSGSGGGLGTLVQALRAAVSAGLSAGKDVAGKLAQSLDNGLQKAEQTLVSQGMDARQAANRVAAFRRELARAVEGAAVQAASQGGAATSAAGSASASGWASSGGAANGSVTAASSPSGSAAPAAAANASTAAAAAGSAAPVSGSSAVSVPQSSAAPASALGVAGAISMRESLQVVMTDGTRVTVRFSEQDSFAAGAAQSADGSVDTLAAALSRGRVQIAVRGNLSAGDLQALDALASQVDALAQQFFSGDVQDAFNSAAALGADPSQIAQFSLQLSYTQIGVVSGSAAASSASPLSGSGAAQPATPAPSTNVASGAVAPATPATPASSAAAPAGDTASVTSSASATGSAPAQPAPGSAQIANFIQDVLGKLGSVSGTTRLNFSMRWKLELLAVTLPAYAAGAHSAPAAGTQHAASTLRSLTG